jgi:twitching motility protein PilT
MAQEIMVITPAIANLIREAKASQIYSQIQMGAKLGMQTMEQAVANLVLSGTIAFEEGMSKCGKPDELQRLVSGAKVGTLSSKTKSRF